MIQQQMKCKAKMKRKKNTDTVHKWNFVGISLCVMIENEEWVPCSNDIRAHAERTFEIELWIFVYCVFASKGFKHPK